MNKISFFKKRFIKILNFLGSENAKLASGEIQKLPDIAKDGFHDAYLTSKLLSIALTFLTKNEFKNFKKESLKANLLTALFALSEVEDQRKESIGNIFAYQEKNTEESLEEMLEIFDQEAESYKSYFQDLSEIKTSCDLFITFYETNLKELDQKNKNSVDVISIQNSHKTPQNDNENSIFLSNPDDKGLIENNGLIIINQLKPCLGILIIAENDSRITACMAHHYIPKTFEEKDLFSAITDLKTELNSKGYSSNLRLVITGGNLMSFSIGIKLIMNYWQDLNLFENFKIYLAPSPENCWSHSVIELVDSQCSMQVGFELYGYDKYLCEEREIEFEGDDDSSNQISGFSSSDLISEESESNTSEQSENSSDSGESSEEASKNSQEIYIIKKRNRNSFYSSGENSESSDEDEPTIKKNRFF
ncbi:MAG: hypothetical protein H0U57_11640 [Tatlockia sp.]|nr:hypothetical protein [Tatlockia sp.]